MLGFSKKDLWLSFIHSYSPLCLYVSESW